MNLDRARALAQEFETALRAHAETHHEELGMVGFAAILAGSAVMAYPKGQEVARAALQDVLEPVRKS